MNNKLCNYPSHYGLIALAFLLGVGFALYNPHKFPADDGFFYLQVAKNIAALGQSTFNTITETNGYHPLWLLMCIPFAWIPFHNPDNLVRAIMLLQGVLFVASLWQLNKLAKKVAINATIPMAVLSVIFIGKGTLFLMETFAALLFLMICLQRFAQQRELESLLNSNKALLLTSVIAGLLILSRLDLVFFVALMMMVIFVSHWKALGAKQAINKGFFLALPAFLMVVIYLSINYTVFGLLFPISGLIKRAQVVSFDVHRLGTEGVLLASATLLIFIVIVIRKYCLPRYHEKFQAIEAVLLLLFLSNFVYVLYVTFTMNDAAPWYYLLAYVLCALFAGYIVKLCLTVSLIEPYLPNLSSLLLVLLLTIGLTFSFLRTYTNYSLFYAFQTLGKTGTFWQFDSARKTLAHELTQLLPNHASVLVFDTPGILALYTQLKIFPTDGLMTGLSYDRNLQTQGTLKYFCSRNVDYFLSPLPTKNHLVYNGTNFTLTTAPQGYLLTLSSPITKQDVAPILLTSENFLNTLENPLNKAQWNWFPQLGLWQLPCNKHERTSP